MQIELLEETEGASNWTFRMQALDDTGALHPFDVRLSWADYNLWSPSGNDQPGEVAVAVLHVMLAEKPISEVRPTFDASLVRQVCMDADRRVTALLPNAMP